MSFLPSHWIFPVFVACATLACAPQVRADEQTWPFGSKMFQQTQPQSTPVPQSPTSIPPPAPLLAPVPALLRIIFAKDDPTLSAMAQANVTVFAIELTRHIGRIELRAYAGEPRSLDSADRRLALKRALAIRSVLIDHGISAERMIVKAFGGVRDTGPTERVDILQAGQ